MDFNRIYMAISHYENIQGRLTFEVYAWEDKKEKPPTKRYSVRPVHSGANVQYPTFETKVEAVQCVLEYNTRSEAFLDTEREVVRTVLLEEANKK